MARMEWNCRALGACRHGHESASGALLQGTGMFWHILHQVHLHTACPCLGNSRATPSLQAAFGVLTWMC